MLPSLCHAAVQREGGEKGRRAREGGEREREGGREGGGERERGERGRGEREGGRERGGERGEDVNKNLQKRGGETCIVYSLLHLSSHCPECHLTKP